MLVLHRSTAFFRDVIIFSATKAVILVLNSLKVLSKLIRLVLPLLTIYGDAKYLADGNYKSCVEDSEMEIS